MTASEQRDMAWSLVCDGGHSKLDVHRATTISDGTIGKMRRILKQLQGDGDIPTSWWMAMQRAKGLSENEWSDEDR